MSVLLPALGPRLVFFTGGTALKGLSRSLTRYTHNSVHLVTPFDSGGSSAALREASFPKNFRAKTGQSFGTKPKPLPCPPWGTSAIAWPLWPTA